MSDRDSGVSDWSAHLPMPPLHLTASSDSGNASYSSSLHPFIIGGNPPPIVIANPPVINQPVQPLLNPPGGNSPQIEHQEDQDVAESSDSATILYYQAEERKLSAEDEPDSQEKQERVRQWVEQQESDWSSERSPFHFTSEEEEEVPMTETLKEGGTKKTKYPRKKITCGECHAAVFNLKRHFAQVHPDSEYRKTTDDVERNKQGYKIRTCPILTCGKEDKVRGADLAIPVSKMIRSTLITPSASLGAPPSEEVAAIQDVPSVAPEEERAAIRDVPGVAPEEDTGDLSPKDTETEEPLAPKNKPTGHIRTPAGARVIPLDINEDDDEELQEVRRHGRRSFLPRDAETLLNLTSDLQQRIFLSADMVVEKLRETPEGEAFLDRMQRTLGVGYKKKLVDRVRAAIRKRKSKE